MFFLFGILAMGFIFDSNFNADAFITLKIDPPLINVPTDSWTIPSYIVINLWSIVHIQEV